MLKRFDIEPFFEVRNARWYQCENWDDEWNKLLELPAQRDARPGYRGFSVQSSFHLGRSFSCTAL